MWGILLVCFSHNTLFGQNGTEGFGERGIANSLFGDNGGDKLVRGHVKRGIKHFRFFRSNVTVLDLDHFFLSAELNGNFVTTLQGQVNGGSGNDCIYGDLICVRNDSQLFV